MLGIVTCVFKHMLGIFGGWIARTYRNYPTTENTAFYLHVERPKCKRSRLVYLHMLYILGVRIDRTCRTIQHSSRKKASDPEARIEAFLR